jgi:hypothetical protein
LSKISFSLSTLLAIEKIKKMMFTIMSPKIKMNPTI